MRLLSYFIDVTHEPDDAVSNTLSGQNASKIVSEPDESDVQTQSTNEIGEIHEQIILISRKIRIDLSTVPLTVMM